MSAIRVLEGDLRKNEYLREVFFSLPIKKGECTIRSPARETEEDRNEIIHKIDEQVLPLFLKEVNPRKASVVLTYPDTGLGRCLSSVVFWAEKNKLYCTALFRSMSLILFPYDYETLSFASKHIINKTGLKEGGLHILIVNLYNKPVPGVKETRWDDFFI